MKKLKLILLAVVLGSMVLLAPAPVRAEKKCMCTTSDGTKYEGVFSATLADKNGCYCPAPNGAGAIEIVMVVINIASGLVLVAAIVGVSIAGVQYLSSAGDVAKMEKSKNRMLHIVIGLVTYALAWTAANFLIPGGILNDKIERLGVTSSIEEVEESTLAAGNTGNTGGTGGVNAPGVYNSSAGTFTNRRNGLTFNLYEQCNNWDGKGKQDTGDNACANKCNVIAAATIVSGGNRGITPKTLGNKTWTNNLSGYVKTFKSQLSGDWSCESKGKYSTNWDQIKAWLKAGKVVSPQICAKNSSWSGDCKGSHYLALLDINDSGEMFIGNSYRPEGKGNQGALYNVGWNGGLTKYVVGAVDVCTVKKSGSTAAVASTSWGKKISDTAESVSWKVGTSEETTQNGSTTAFMNAYKTKTNLWEKYKLSSEYNIGRSCDIFVGVVLQASGADPEFPGYKNEVQLQYLENSSLFEEIKASSVSDLKGGDVLASTGHIKIIVDIDGELYEAQAAFKNYTGRLSKGVKLGSFRVFRRKD